MPDPGEGEREVPFRATDGLARRAVLTPPSDGATGALGVLLLHGLTPAPHDGAAPTSAALAHELASRGACVLRYAPRVSVVPPDAVAAVDLEAELADAAGACEALRAARAVDPARLILLGMSLGGVAAPIVAGRVGRVAGIVSWGATARRWTDYARANLHVQLAFRGTPPRRIAELAALLDGWHDALAETERSAEEVLAAEPALGRLGLTDTGHFGRSAAFWRQVVRLDPPASYRGLSCRVLAVRGAADCSAQPEDLESIVTAASKAGLEVESAVLAGVDHGFREWPGPKESLLAGGGGEPSCAAFAEAVVDWATRPAPPAAPASGSPSRTG